MTIESFTPEPYWFLHHEMILEWTTEPVENRIEYIRDTKARLEVPVRLEALRPVKYPERLPLGVVEAWRAYKKSYQTHVSAWWAYEEAWRASLPLLVAQYLEEYPENAGLFDHTTRHLIFPRTTE